MTNEELVQLYQDGHKQFLNELVEQNKRIVYKLANKFYVEKTNSIDKEDLIQEGFIGFILAADKYKFDEEHTCKFSTYAVYWVYQKMNRYVNTKNTNEESSLNTPIGDDKDTELMNYIEDVDYSFENIEEKIYRQQLRKELDKVMYENLTLQDRNVLKLRYGWDNNTSMTFKEVGEVLSVKGERVRQIESKSFNKIRRTPWGRDKSKEYYSERFISENTKIDEKIKALDFKQKYLNTNSFDNYLDRVIEGIE